MLQQICAPNLECWFIIENSQVITYNSWYINYNSSFVIQINNKVCEIF